MRETMFRQIGAVVVATLACGVGTCQGLPQGQAVSSVVTSPGAWHTSPWRFIHPHPDFLLVLTMVGLDEPLSVLILVSVFPGESGI